MDLATALLTLTVLLFALVGASAVLDDAFRARCAVRARSLAAKLGTTLRTGWPYVTAAALVLRLLSPPTATTSAPTVPIDPLPAHIAVALAFTLLAAAWHAAWLHHSLSRAALYMCCNCRLATARARPKPRTAAATATPTTATTATETETSTNTPATTKKKLTKGERRLRRAALGASIADAAVEAAIAGLRGTGREPPLAHISTIRTAFLAAMLSVLNASPTPTATTNATPPPPAPPAPVNTPKNKRKQKRKSKGKHTPHAGGPGNGTAGPKSSPSAPAATRNTPKAAPAHAARAAPSTVPPASFNVSFNVSPNNTNTNTVTQSQGGRGAQAPPAQQPKPAPKVIMKRGDAPNAKATHTDPTLGGYAQTHAEETPLGDLYNFQRPPSPKTTPPRAKSTTFWAVSPDGTVIPVSRGSGRLPRDLSLVKDAVSADGPLAGMVVISGSGEGLLCQLSALCVKLTGRHNTQTVARMKTLIDAAVDVISNMPDTLQAPCTAPPARSPRPTWYRRPRACWRLHTC